MSQKLDKIEDGFFASCPTGLEEILEQEIKELNTSETQIVKGGVHFVASNETSFELMLSSRIASRIHKKLYKFEIKNEKDLYFFGKQIKWNELFDLQQTFKISVIQGLSLDSQKRSRFKSPIFLAQTLKDAIVDRFRDDEKGERPNIDKHSPDFSLLVRVEPKNDPYSQKEDVTILADMCGAPLSQRGYRDTNFSAPLKENLAAGLVKLSGYTGEEALVDPMCGSGTIIIESLLMKGNIPPSYIAIDEILHNNDNEYWDFMSHNYFAKNKKLKESFSTLIDTYYEKAKAGFTKLRESEVQTFASDIQKYAINATRYNLRAANLEEFVNLTIEDATKLVPEVDGGMIITNPPYGERIGSEDNLAELYHEFGENMKNNFKNFKAYVFTGNLPLLKKVSLRTSKKIILFNGNIDSRLAEYLLY